MTTTTLATNLVILFGGLLLIAGAVGLLFPAKLVAAVKAIVAHPAGIYFAVLIRLLLGVVLIIAAPQSAFPLTFEVLGWIIILAAILIAFMGRARIKQLTTWWAQRSITNIRLMFLLGVLIGAGLLYAVLSKA